MLNFFLISELDAPDKISVGGTSAAVTEANDFPISKMAQRRASKFSLKNPVHRMRSVKIKSKGLEYEVNIDSNVDASVINHGDLNLPVQMNASRQEDVSSTLSDNENKKEAVAAATVTDVTRAPEPVSQD